MTVPSSVCVRCDGCDDLVASDGLALPHHDGHEARYCTPCNEHYEEFYRLLQIEETRLNRLLDAFVSELRGRIPLRFVPQDLPPRVQPIRGGSGLVLG